MIFQELYDKNENYFCRSLDISEFNKKYVQETCNAIAQVDHYISDGMEGKGTRGSGRYGQGKRNLPFAKQCHKKKSPTSYWG